MKKYILGLVVLCIALPAAAQVSWKDSVISSHKVLDAYAGRNLVYFKAKKGWGVYSLREKKVLIEPAYQFILDGNDDANAGYYIVSKGKAGFINPDGTVKTAPAHSMLGYVYDEVHDRYTITDNRIAKDNTGKSYPYYLSPAVQKVNIEIQGDLALVTVNENRSPEEAGLRGQVLQSGVFDLKAGKWLMQPVHPGQISAVKNTILLHTIEPITTGDGGYESYVTLYDAKGNLLHKYPEEETYAGKKAIEAILGAYEAKMADTLPFDGMVVFTSGQKYGLYDAARYTVLIEPVEYDFLHVPHSDPRFVFTLKNKKAGMLYLDDAGISYSNIYDKLSLHTYVTRDENTLHIMECAPGNYEAFLMNDKRWDGNKAIGANDAAYFRLLAGMQVAGSNIVVTDITPRGEMGTMPLTTMYGEDSVIVHEDGTMQYVYPPREPRRSLSGVFSLETGKWIVPRRYTLVQPNATGYACLRDYNDSITYASYTLQGKEIFKDLALDQVKENTGMLRSFVGLANGSAELVKRCRAFDEFRSEPDQAIIRTGNTFGVFDMQRLQWTMEPGYQFIDFNILTATYTVVDSGRVGLADYTGKLIVPAAFREIELAGNYFIANDSALYKYARIENNLMSGIETAAYPGAFIKPYGFADTLPQGMIDFQMYFDKYVLNVYKSKSNLVTEEWHDASPYDGNENNTDTVFTRIADMGSKKITPFTDAWELTPVNDGHVSVVSRMTLDELYIYDAAGKIQLRMPRPDSAATSGTLLFYSKPDTWFQDLQGNLVKPGKVDETYFDHKYRPAGFNYTYYTGGRFTQAPKDFMVQAVSTQGLLLGYRIVTDTKTGKPRKEFTYYDPATKTYSPCELVFSGGQVRVYPVMDMFVMVDYDYATRRINCFVLENDLKTIKSTFKDLYAFNAGPAIRLNPRPYYVLKKEKTAMYFDNGFQFLMEVPDNENIQYSQKWRRAVLRGKNKRLVFDFSGRHLK